MAQPVRQCVVALKAWRLSVALPQPLCEWFPWF
jgi:hypothetical protein